MSLTKLSLAGNNLIIPVQGELEFIQWHPGWGRENRYPFYSALLKELNLEEMSAKSNTINDSFNDYIHKYAYFQIFNKKNFARDSSQFPYK
jgi:hypothetical protein